MNFSGTKFYLGADSGGTKFELIIVSEYGRIIRKFKFIGIHYSVSGPVSYCETISKYISTAVKKAGFDINNCKGLCIGLAGAREESDRRKLKSLFRKKPGIRNTLITSDALTALYGAFEGRSGIILISGTGSVLYGYFNNKINRVGGWGRIIGDEGSGYWIGKKALNIIAKEYDTFINTKKESDLSELLRVKFGINRLNLNDRIFKNKFEIQKITPFVLELAEKNSEVCINIIREAVSDLIYHINAYLDIAKPEIVMDISLIGSLVENENILSRKLKKEIMKLKKVNLVEKKHSPAYGAYLLISGSTKFLTKIKIEKN